MCVQPKRIALVIACSVLASIASIAFAPMAQAASYTISDPGGGDCGTIGSWNSSAHTCTLNTDITFVSTVDGIEIASDGITLDGANHVVTGYNRTGDGIKVQSRNGVFIKNLYVTRFAHGIYLLNSGAGTANIIVGNDVYENGDGIVQVTSSNNTIMGNSVYQNSYYGIYIFGSSNNTTVSANTLAWNSTGLYHTTSSNSLIYGNQFWNNAAYGFVLAASTNTSILANNFELNASPGLNSGGSGLSVSGNWWDSYDSPTEGCINTTPFDDYCDSPYTPPSPGGGFSDSHCYLLMGGWNRYDFTWYDGFYADNWVLMSNTPQFTGTDLWLDLVVAGIHRYIPPLPGYAQGQLPPDSSFTPAYPGLMGGPVSVFSQLAFPTPVASQRILWPNGGDSLEEVPGMSASTLTNNFWWPWYDMQTPGYKNWIMISNPNAFDIVAVISLGDMALPSWTGTIPSGGYAAETFPGLRDGPVRVQAFVDGTSDPAKVMASQRVLMNGDTDFNELPGMPQSGSYLTTWDYVWPWYDQQTPGATDWLLITNPPTNMNPIYYEVLLGGTPLASGGPVNRGDSVTPYFPGNRGGPLEVRTYFDAGHIWPAPSICSQRTLWGSSFEETLGMDKTSLAASYDWTWYDQKSAGSLNWVLAANPSATDTITATFTFTDQASGAPQSASGDIPPGSYWTTNFPGKMGGPVSLTAVRQGTGIAMPVIASQRVLWNGNFNEVWGQ